MFDENSLRAEIVNKWGAHGAHVEVFDMLLAEAELWSRKHCEEAVRVEGENLELQRKNDALQGALVDSRAEVGRLESVTQAQTDDAEHLRERLAKLRAEVGRLTSALDAAACSLEVGFPYPPETLDN